MNVDVHWGRFIAAVKCDDLFMEVIGDNPCPWVRLRAARVPCPPNLREYEQSVLEKKLCEVPHCDGTLSCILNSVRVVFTTAGIAQSRRCWLLQPKAGKPRTPFAAIIMDECSRHTIPTMIDLMSYGTRSVAVGDMQLPPYTYISMLAGNVEAPNDKSVGWPTRAYFANCKVDIAKFNATDGWREMLDFEKTSGLHFLLYRCRVMGVHLVQQHRMVPILAHVTRALFSGCF